MTLSGNGKKPAPTVLVTGASKGIGLETALYLAERKFRVILLARGREDLENAAEKVRARACTAGLSQDDVETLVGDVSDEDFTKGEIPKLRLLESGLFGLVNNAACEIVKPLVEFDVKEMTSIWKTNMLAPALMIQICLPFLKKGGGSIVNIGSVADRNRFPGYSVYGGSKAFLVSFTSHLATEIGYEGIRVNVVTPGGISTPLMQKIEAQFPADQIAREKSKIPIGQRWGRPQEVAEAVHFCLTGPDYLHGADIRIDGGVF